MTPFRYLDPAETVLLDAQLDALIVEYDARHPEACYATIGRLSPDDPVTEDEKGDRYPLPGSYRPPPIKKQSLTKDAYAELVKPYAGWWTMAQVAHALQVDLMTITNYRKRGLLACVDITGGVTKTNKRKWFVHPDDAARFIAQHKAVNHG